MIIYPLVSALVHYNWLNDFSGAAASVSDSLELLLASSILAWVLVTHRQRYINNKINKRKKSKAGRERKKEIQDRGIRT